MENGAIGARFGTKTCFLVPLGAEFQFYVKIVAGLETKNILDNLHNQKQQFSKHNTVQEGGPPHSYPQLREVMILYCVLKIVVFLVVCKLSRRFFYFQAGNNFVTKLKFRT